MTARLGWSSVVSLAVGFVLGAALAPLGATWTGIGTAGPSSALRPASVNHAPVERRQATGDERSAESMELAALRAEIGALGDQIRALRGALGARSTAPRPDRRVGAARIVSPEERQASTEQARRLVEAGIASGTWRSTDRARLRALAASLSPEEASDLREQLIVAHNNGQVKFEGRPF